MSEQLLLSIVIPAYNEATAIGAVIDDVAHVLRDDRHELIVVDDGSTDGTWDVLARLRARHPALSAIRLTRNFGHQAALLAGLLASRGDAVITMDADGQHPPACIPRFVEAWRRGFPVVQGVRTSTPGEGALKRWTSRGFYRLFSASGGPVLAPGSADFRLLARPVLQSVIDSIGPLLFLRGLIPWLGYPTAEVAFEAGPRRGGATKYTWWRMLRFSVHGLLSFTLVPLRAAMLLGAGMAALSLVYLVPPRISWTAG